MLHLPGGVGVGGDVGDLLQLQGPLERHRQADVPAYVEEELAPPELLGDGLDLLAHSREDLVDAMWQALDLADQLGQPRGLERASQLGQAQSQ